MTPLLPRAPMSAPWEMARQISARPAPARRSSSLTAASVKAMLVPVSPSGTGYTFSRSIVTRC